MKVCPSCNQQNGVDQDFCIGCGTELPSDSGAAIAVAVAAQAQAPAPVSAPASTQPALFTITIGDQSIPVYEGSVFTIARAGSPVQPTFEVAADDVSSTPLELKVENGVMTAGYGGAEPKSFAVVKNIKPGEQVEVESGEMLMLGASTFIFVS